MQVASFQYSEVLLRNRALFRNCNGQFLNMMTVRLREVYLMPGEVHLRQGDMSRDMGFVTHGSLECSKDNVLLRTVRKTRQEMHSGKQKEKDEDRDW